MRGADIAIAARSRKQRPMDEATARPYSHPSPYLGWNARGNLANMDPKEAIQMDNVFPGVQTVGVRKGSATHATGAAANIKALLPYSGASTNKLFACASTGIYDVTAAGAIGAAVASCTNGEWESLNIATAGGNFLFCVNGTDSAKTFDGTTWAVPAITVATSSTWNYVALHKKRIWAIEENSMKLWYLPVDSIAGAATLFPVGSLFKKGGYLVAIGAWSLDGGSGLDDLFVIVTSNGEIAVYQGTDPASSTTWQLVGVYTVGKPVGKKPLLDYGGDLLYLSQVGLVPLSSLTQSTVIDRSKQISYNIDGAFLDAADAYGSIYGWQMLTHNHHNLLIVNVPVSLDSFSYQFVMNTITKAWCRFIGWNATCWAEFNGLIYFAGGTTVYQAWTGTTDSGEPIQASVMQAYSYLGSRQQKNVVLARPNFGLSGSAQISLALDTDFKTFNGETIFTYAPAPDGAIWDVDLWDTGIWDSGSSTFEPKWTTVPGDLGYLHSFRLQISTSSGNFVWTSTDFAHRPAGIL